MTLNKPNLSRAGKSRLNKIARAIILLVVIAVPIILITRMVKAIKPGSTASAKKPQTSLTDSQLAGPSASIPINYDFTYPISSSANKDPKASDLTFSVQNAEKRKEILVQGKKATAVNGRTFLVLNVKITNPNQHGVQINTRDFFRLASNDNQTEWLAPETHNDPVEVQAISTKYTRLGFPVNETDKNLILQVGQINGEKHQIPLNI